MECSIASVMESEIPSLRTFYSSLESDTSITNNLVFDFDRKENTQFYKVTINDEIVGMGSVVFESTSFADLRRFIHPEYRSNRIGDCLLDFIVAEATLHKKSHITGWFPGNSDAVIQYFNSKGFKAYGLYEGHFVRLSLLNSNHTPKFLTPKT